MARDPAQLRCCYAGPLGYGGHSQNGRRRIPLQNPAHHRARAVIGLRCTPSFTDAAGAEKDRNLIRRIIFSAGQNCHGHCAPGNHVPDRGWFSFEYDAANHSAKISLHVFWVADRRSPTNTWFPFNADLFEAEHQMIEDEQASTDTRTRRNFGAQWKGITANDEKRCHAKNRTPVSLTPFWRLSVSVNDEPENLMVLPPIDDSIEDKLIILRASRSPKGMPMPTVTLAQRKAFWETLVGELPAFIHFLKEWKIPRELKSDRFGITHFHHPEILQAIDALAPEFRLLSLIDDQCFDGSRCDTDWQGTAEELERQLTNEDSPCRYEARHLLTYNTACGVYLGRLAKKYPGRFSLHRTETTRTWTIKPLLEPIEMTE